VNSHVTKRPINVYHAVVTDDIGGVSSLPMMFPDIVKQWLTVNLSTQLCAQQKAAGHFAMQRIYLLWRRSQAMLQHHWQQLMNSNRRALLTKVKDFISCKRLTQNHHCVYMCLLHHLQLFRVHFCTMHT